MKTIILIGLVGSLGTGLYGVASQVPAVAGLLTPSTGAVTALGAALLLLVGKYLPTRDKQFTDAITKVTTTYAESMDKAGERGDKLVATILKERE